MSESFFHHSIVHFLSKGAPSQPGLLRPRVAAAAVPVRADAALRLRQRLPRAVLRGRRPLRRRPAPGPRPGEAEGTAGTVGTATTG